MGLTRCYKTKGFFTFILSRDGTPRQGCETTRPGVLERSPYLLLRMQRIQRWWYWPVRSAKEGLWQNRMRVRQRCPTRQRPCNQHGTSCVWHDHNDTIHHGRPRHDGSGSRYSKTLVNKYKCRSRSPTQALHGLPLPVSLLTAPVSPNSISSPLVLLFVHRLFGTISSVSSLKAVTTSVGRYHRLSATVSTVKNTAVLCSTVTVLSLLPAGISGIFRGRGVMGTVPRSFTAGCRCLYSPNIS